MLKDYLYFLIWKTDRITLVMEGYFFIDGCNIELVDSYQNLQIYVHSHLSDDIRQDAYNKGYFDHKNSSFFHTCQSAYD